MALKKCYLIAGNSCHSEVLECRTEMFCAPAPLVFIVATHATHQPARCYRKGEQAGDFYMCEKELSCFGGVLLVSVIW